MCTLPFFGLKYEIKILSTEICELYLLNIFLSFSILNLLTRLHINTVWVEEDFLFDTYTIMQNITSSEICALHLTHSSAHTPGAVARHPGSSWGFGALLKGLTSVVVLKVERTLVIHPPHNNSCQSRDSNPQPRVTSPMLYPLGHNCPVWMHFFFISIAKQTFNTCFLFQIFPFFSCSVLF